MIINALKDFLNTCPYLLGQKINVDFYGFLRLAEEIISTYDMVAPYFKFRWNSHFLRFF